ncbi:hypothetical protein B0H15DRAFT_806612 [Mycena belliarum]|uniref:Uncharacterized protein n=1 Tax=Mycena belliarum TaxID=1033014 RepID=A0AAD6TND3_9AGAR|nr:hypothetical protein B0H15DRAFT_806612 [Mycena belliae]
MLTVEPLHALTRLHPVRRPYVLLRVLAQHEPVRWPVLPPHHTLPAHHVDQHAHRLHGATALRPAHARYAQRVHLIGVHHRVGGAIHMRVDRGASKIKPVSTWASTQKRRWPSKVTEIGNEVEEVCPAFAKWRSKRREQEAHHIALNVPCVYPMREARKRAHAELARGRSQDPAARETLLFVSMQNGGRKGGGELTVVAEVVPAAYTACTRHCAQVPEAWAMAAAPSAPERFWPPAAAMDRRNPKPMLICKWCSISTSPITRCMPIVLESLTLSLYISGLYYVCHVDFRPARSPLQVLGVY